MHELGIMYNIVKRVLQVAKDNNVTEIERLVLEVGELSPVVPQYLDACYPASVDGTIMENTKLELEILPATSLCNGCKRVFKTAENKNCCPYCNTENGEIITGKEFLIKEIVAK